MAGCGRCNVPRPRERSVRPSTRTTTPQASRSGAGRRSPPQFLAGRLASSHAAFDRGRPRRPRLRRTRSRAPRRAVAGVHVPRAIDEPGVSQTRPAHADPAALAVDRFRRAAGRPSLRPAGLRVARSGLLRFWGDPFTTDEFKALFAFLGVALGVVAIHTGGPADQGQQRPDPGPDVRRATVEQRPRRRRASSGSFVQTRESHEPTAAGHGHPGAEPDQERRPVRRQGRHGAPPSPPWWCWGIR